jgi:hypothetical protein
VILSPESSSGGSLPVHQDAAVYAVLFDGAEQAT